ncbi:alpha/beta hydrolase [Paenibacillus sp. ISL-20]|uniref:alpha/beta fold hydrolase n=1 Tax=Paenibacillus sp. ISL-20 TaxID=2819163 RepID=UPI001BEC27CC|nr:alpha/beta hydrolase [Paenibacillus sp. ISL-20]MBT2764452.1 alpha/beta hydrolase [Paenibacillus sp. ISL-20]
MIQDYVEVDDGQIFYSVCETCPDKDSPMVLLHGNFNDHQIWNEQVESLSTQYKIIRYDLRGYGLSSTPKSPFSNVQDLKTIVDSLKLHHMTLIGSSLGGGVAIDFTLAYPHLAQALILVSPSIQGNHYPMNMMWQGIKNHFNVRVKSRERAIKSFITNPYWQYFFPSMDRPEAREKVLLNVRNTHNFCRFSPSLATTIKPHAIHRLSEINIPTLIIISDRDHPFNIKTAETLHKNIRRSSKIIMKNCGHLPFIEEYQEFNQTVLDFLSRLNFKA